MPAGNGTLHRRFVNTPAAGKVRAKTGSLEGVAGLSGWASTQDGTAMAFALLANRLPTMAAGSALQDRVAAAVASYPQAPPPGEPAPRRHRRRRLHRPRESGAGRNRAHQAKAQSACRCSRWGRCSCPGW